MNKLLLSLAEQEQIEHEYGEKLRKASIAENHDEMMSLFFELNILRKFYKKQGLASARQRKNDIRK